MWVEAEKGLGGFEFPFLIVVHKLLEGSIVHIIMFIFMLEQFLNEWSSIKW